MEPFASCTTVGRKTERSNLFVAHDGGMDADAGEALFERYVTENGYKILDRHPDLGTQKRPDYLVLAAGVEVVVEVESFNLPSAASVGDVALLDMRPQLKNVRNKITAGAEQLKGIDGYPLAVVLANPKNAHLPLEGPMFEGALYGDPMITIDGDGETDMRFGRNGRLHVTELDGSVRGNHPHLSAVAVLRRSYSDEAHAAAMQASQSLGYENILATVREAHRRMAEMGEDATQAVCLDIYETVSRSAIPLPRDVFAGPHDTRWGEVAEGRYGQIERERPGRHSAASSIQQSATCEKAS
ncbi:hypothetical protein ACFQ9X_37305 [Catenulispora yoronensis]